MSPSLSKIRTFANRALTKQPSDWETATRPFKRHLWNDLYSEEKVTEISKVFGRERPVGIHELRLLLTAAGDSAVKTFQLIGGPAPDGKKRDWADRVIKDAKRLKSTLQSVDAHAMPLARLEMREGKKIGRIVSASVMETAALALVRSVDELLALIEPIVDQQPARISKRDEAGTFHALYLQEAVDRMTDVFVFLRGIDEVKRTTDKGGSRGEYPDFIRATALPLLAVYYPQFDRKKSKLDAQIQDAITRYRWNGR